MYVLTCICVDFPISTYIHIYRKARGHSWLFFLFLFCLFYLFILEAGLLWLHVLSPLSSILCWDCRHVLPCQISFYVGSGGLNSGPFACTEHIFPVKPYLQPEFYFILFYFELVDLWPIVLIKNKTRNPNVKLPVSIKIKKLKEKRGGDWKDGSAVNAFAFLTEE